MSISYKSIFHLFLVFTSRGLSGLGTITLSIVIALISGAEGLGQFTFNISVVMMLMLISKYGLDICLLRVVANRLASKNNNQLLQFFCETIKITSLYSIIIMVLGWIIFSIIMPDLEHLGIMIWAVLPLTMLAVISGYLKGHNKSPIAAILEIGGVSLFLSAILWLLYKFQLSLNVKNIGILFLITVSFISILAIFWSIKDARRKTSNIKPLNVGDRKELRRGDADLMLISVTGFVSGVGVFVLVGPFLTPVDLGVLRAAERLAAVIVLPLAALEPFMMPKVVEYVVRDRVQLPLLMLKVCTVSVVCALPLALALTIFPQAFLELFGAGFDRAVTPLCILAVSQLIVAMLGPFSGLLAMTGQEQLLRRIQVVGLCASILVLPVAASLSGLIGFSIGFAVVNCVKYIFIFGYAVHTEGWLRQSKQTR